ncbi:hypothetical protein M758_5G031900 [Ceratodon purpureus]|nr:hypothetical protein M758_5G031900 [Ceratodon purpureus]
MSRFSCFYEIAKLLALLQFTGACFRKSGFCFGQGLRIFWSIRCMFYRDGEATCGILVKPLFESGGYRDD